VVVEDISSTPWENFNARFAAAARSEKWDLVWLSHVFFDSGFVVRDLEAICAAAPADAMVCIDGYHAFCALPVDLSRVHRRAFYLAGGYKYAMSGKAPVSSRFHPAPGCGPRIRAGSRPSTRSPRRRARRFRTRRMRFASGAPPSILRASTVSTRR